MVRLEKQGDSFVMITGATQKLDINSLINAISESQKPSPDRATINEGLLYLDESAKTDLRAEFRNILQKAMDKKGLTITDL